MIIYIYLYIECTKLWASEFWGQLGKRPFPYLHHGSIVENHCGSLLQQSGAVAPVGSCGEGPESKPESKPLTFILANGRPFLLEIWGNDSLMFYPLRLVPRLHSRLHSRRWHRAFAACHWRQICMLLPLMMYCSWILFHVSLTCCAGPLTKLGLLTGFPN